MLFASRMKKVSLVTHSNYLDSVIHSLHESGLMQITDIHRETPQKLKEIDVERADMYPEAGECATYEMRLTRIIKILSRFAKKQKGIASILHPKPVEKKQIQHRSLPTILKEANLLLSKTEEMVVQSEEKMSDLDIRLDTLDDEMKILELLLPFDLDCSWLGESQYLQLKAGLTQNILALRETLQKGEVEILSKEKKEKKEKNWIVILIAHKSTDLGKTYKQFFEEFTLPQISGKPSSLLQQHQQEKEKINREKKEIVSTIKNLHATYNDALLAIREEIVLEKIRKETPIKFAKTHQTFLIDGWVLEKNVLMLQDLINKSTQGHSECRFSTPSSNPDDVPIHLEIPTWAKPFKTFLELFALPRYNEVNPSLILGVFFILFFAIMLGDAGYGLLILFTSLFGYIRLGKHSSMIKEWSFMGIWLGISTTIAGFIFNGFFGDFIPRFIYGNPKELLYTLGPLPIDAIHKPVTILLMSLILGLTHLNLGIILGLYQNIKNRFYRDIIKTQLPWFFLQIGGGALVGYAMLHIWHLSTMALALAGILTGIGLMGLFLHSGAIGFFDLTGFVGDWLSYARLLALGLATAGMALAFNIVAEVFSQMIPVIGIVLLPIILVVAHFANFILQSLGAAIHSLRLQYVEFFNRFYQGGGKEFVPFKIKRKYTEVKK